MTLAKAHTTPIRFIKGGVLHTLHNVAPDRTLLEVLRDKEFAEKARAAGFSLGPMGRADTAKRLAAEDAAMYPVFLEAGLVRARQK